MGAWRVVGHWCLVVPVLLLAPGSSGAAPTTAPSHDVAVDARADEVIRGALRYLASKQSPAGAWSSGGNHSAAITGYVLVAYLTAGQLPNEGEHGRTVAKGVDFLLDCVRPDGYIAASTGESNMYGHGIAAIVLGEVYGQTRDPTIRPKLQRAVKLIVACQNHEGGWRYQPRVMDADISVTVLQVVALRVAKNSGIDVPQETIDRAVGYVKRCAHPGGGFGYQANRSAPGFARTAAAVYSLQVCGLYDDPLVKKGSQYLFDRYDRDREWYTYGGFYAAPAQYMIGGDTWRRWYAQVSKTLLASVRQQGENYYWQPLEGGRGVNDVYATAVYTSILAMPYSYMPIYQR